MSDLDVTGGNSGSATLNGRGELVGLLFDGTLDSVNSDWDFDPETTRAIHVDTRYMLWVMDKVDGARRVIDEMTVVGLPPEPVPALTAVTVDPALNMPVAEAVTLEAEPAIVPDEMSEAPPTK